MSDKATDKPLTLEISKEDKERIDNICSDQFPPSEHEFVVYMGHGERQRLKKTF